MATNEYQREYMRARYKANPALQINSDLKKYYGITIWDWMRMMIEQENKCKICGDPLRLGKGNMAVDHCHETGRVRGLLCYPCNQGLGGFRDRPELMLAAIEYLKVLEESE